MEQRIVDYHQDAEEYWVAELECGHFPHLRHNPPWVIRAWVVHPDGRESMKGKKLECKKCTAGAPRDWQ